MNSRPLVANSADDDGIEALTPGHFLIGRQIAALPDPAYSYCSTSLLRRWHLCQNITLYFWQTWSLEYLVTLRKYVKWHRPTRNLSVGDIVMLHENNMVPAQWPLGRIVETFASEDGLVRVARVKTQHGVFKRPTHKLALLLSCDSDNDRILKTSSEPLSIVCTIIIGILSYSFVRPYGLRLAVYVVYHTRVLTTCIRYAIDSIERLPLVYFVPL